MLQNLFFDYNNARKLGVTAKLTYTNSWFHAGRSSKINLGQFIKICSIKALACGYIVSRMRVK